MPSTLIKPMLIHLRRPTEVRAAGLLPLLLPQGTEVDYRLDYVGYFKLLHVVTWRNPLNGIEYAAEVAQKPLFDVRPGHRVLIPVRGILEAVVLKVFDEWSIKVRVISSVGVDTKAGVDSIIRLRGITRAFLLGGIDRHEQYQD